MEQTMASEVRRPRVKQVPRSEIKDDLSRFLREGETRESVITRHGNPAGVLTGLANDDRFEYRLENDPRFLKRVADGDYGPDLGCLVRSITYAYR
jgi:prevent-host-death family protein